MLTRILMVVITLFWVLMNVLLWRAEYGAHRLGGPTVPTELVWRKMLTAPDSSSLSILHHGQKIGFCHWTTSVGEDLARLKPEDVPPEGMVRKVTGYRVQLEGNLAWEEFTNRLRFDCNLKLTTNQLWQEFSLRVNLRPSIWEIHVLAAQQAIHLRVDDGEGGVERVFRFADLQDPEALLSEVGGPLASGVFSSLAWPGVPRKGASLAQNLHCEAHNDSIKIGHALVRAYRLEARWMGRYRAVLYISRVGEILRLELPDEIVLENDQLANF